MSFSESEMRQQHHPTAARDALTEARRGRESFERRGVSPFYLGRRLKCAPDWAAIEITIALRLLADARGVQQ